jgi:drug/metabolite transporter (DMT)-like permease
MELKLEINKNMSNILTVIFLVILIVLCGGSAQYFARSFYDTKDLKDLVISGTFFSIALVIIYKAYDYHHVYLLNNLWSCLSIIYVYLIGYLFWNEKLTNYEIAATALIIIGIFVIYS